MKLWKLTCISLVGLLLVGCSASGGADNISEETTTEVAEVTTAAPYLDTLGAKNFNGETFSVTGVDYATRRNFPNDDEVGEVVNDSLIERDRIITERYNVEIDYSRYEKSGEQLEALRKSILANEGIWHMAINTISGSLLNLMNESLLLDMGELDDLDFTADWWSSNIYDNTNLNGKIYIMMGDISPQKYYSPYALAFNKKLAEANHFPDLYEMVLSGKWTIDEFGELLKDAERDLDGDGEMTIKDFWGYSHVNTVITGNAHFVGAGGVLATSNEDGITVDLITDKNTLIVEKLQNTIVPMKYSDMSETNTVFMEDRAIFYGNSLSNMIAEFRKMESDYGIIPVPKFDELQEKYYAYINTWCLGGVAVPMTCPNREMTGFLMEALCYQSYETVRPALRENLLKQKVSRDASSAQTLDMILDNTYIDMNGLYNFGGSSDFVGNCIVNPTEYVSGLTKIENAIQADIQKLMSELVG